MTSEHCPCPSPTPNSPLPRLPSKFPLLLGMCWEEPVSCGPKRENWTPVYTSLAAWDSPAYPKGELFEYVSHEKS